MEEPEATDAKCDAEYAHIQQSARDEMQEEGPEVRLSEGIDLGHLTSGETFEIADEVAKNEFVDDGYYKPEESYEYLNPDAVDCGDEDDESSPFERLSKDMTSVTEDKGVLKKVVTQGVGDQVPEAAYVQIHYNAHVEYGDTPFDSSRIKNRSLRFRLGKESDSMKNVIWGVDIAVASMRKKERSKFLISPEYAFGKLGCPPRIPPEATLLYDIELIDFTDTMGLDEYYSLTAAERKEASFDLVKKVVEKERKEGNDMFNTGRRHGAISKYKRAIQRLQECRLKDEDEENVQKKLLLRTLLNIALCYMKEKMSKKCLHATNEAIHIDSNSVKAFYLRGKALIQLAEFDRAKQALNKAKELKPRDKDIIAAFNEFEAKCKKYNMDERKLYQAMFGLKTDDNSPRDKTVAYSEEFKDIIHSQVLEFVQDEEMTEFPLRMRNLTAGEIQCIKDVAEEFKLEVAEVGVDNNAHYRIKKSPIISPPSEKEA